MDLPSASEPAWAFERVDRCQIQIWSVVKDLAARDIPSVLDFGFVRRQDRMTVANLAAAESLSVKLHYLDTPAHIRWQRVQARNVAQGQNFRFEIPRARFDYTESIWQPPSEAELVELNGVRVGENSPLIANLPTSLLGGMPTLLLAPRRLHMDCYPDV